MLETEYSAYGDQYHACWCPGSWSRQGITRHGIDNMHYCSNVNFIYLVQANSNIWLKMWIYLLQALKEFSMLRVNIYVNIYVHMLRVILYTRNPTWSHDWSSWSTAGIMTVWCRDLQENCCSSTTRLQINVYPIMLTRWTILDFLEKHSNAEIFDSHDFRLKMHEHKFKLS